MLYGILKIIAILFFKIFYAMKVVGGDNLPTSTGYIVSPNHTHWLDIPAVGVALPKKMASFAKKELFHNRISAWFFRSLGAIPVDRASADLASIKLSKQALQKGMPLLLFPEGTRSRSGELLQGKRGAVYLATLAKVPIVPTGIIGFGRKSPKAKRNQLVVCFGTPFYPFEMFNPQDKDYYRKATDYLMEQIKRCLQKAEEQL